MREIKLKRAQYFGTVVIITFIFGLLCCPILEIVFSLLFNKKGGGSELSSVTGCFFIKILNQNLRHVLEKLTIYFF